jgi:hypothetical protein
MNRNPDDTRFHAWLAERAPRSAPDGLLARATAALDGDRRPQGRWGWPLSRSVMIVPAFATVVVVALVAVLVLNGLPHTPQPVAEGSASPTGTASASPSPSPPSPTASASLSPTDTPVPTPVETPGPTPIMFPSPAATTTPVIVGPAGTLTFRLVLQSLPAGTQSITLDLAPPREEGFGPLTPPPGGFPTFTMCGGGTNPTPCTAPATYEQLFSGFAPNTWVGYAFTIELGGTNPAGDTVSIGQRRANGSLVAVTYPVPDLTGPWGSCAGDLLHHARIDFSLRDYTGSGSYTAPADLCIWRVVWEPGNSTPGAGTATLTRDGEPVYSIDLAHFGDDIGTFGGPSSGDLSVVLSYPIPVARGQVLDLAFSGCPSCAGNLGVAIEAAAP